MDAVKEKAFYRTKWTIRRYDSAEYERLGDAAIPRAFGDLPPISEIDGNILLNEGIALLLDLLIGAGGTAYNNANAYLGVGESSTGESAAHTGLQGSSKTYKGMSATYPQRASQTVTWRAVFATGDANNAWNEFTIVNANSDTGTNLNRKVSAQGTKAAGQTWTLDMTLTIS